MAEKKIEYKAPESNAAEEISTDDYLNERIPIMLMKDNDKYKYDVEVGVNGYKYIIQRGVQVMVPRKVALVLESTYRQQVIYSNLIESKKSKE